MLQTVSKIRRIDNMKILILLQAVLSALSGILVSQMSWISRVGISLFYRDYAILKSWWQTALLFFAILLVLDIIQLVIKKKSSLSALFISIILVIGLLGLYVTFHDFTTKFTHELLREKSHTGFYLFWLTWIGSSVYFLVIPKAKKA
jgi:hypothetical protein